MNIKINDRAIQIVECNTNKKWLNRIPSKNWLCILVNNEKPYESVKDIIRKIIEKNVCYVCTAGNLSEAIHDNIDQEIISREVNAFKYLPKHHIMTTWEENIVEAIWYGTFAAHHESVEIHQVIILDLTNGKETDRIKRELERLNEEDHKTPKS